MPKSPGLVILRQISFFDSTLSICNGRPTTLDDLLRILRQISFFCSTLFSNKFILYSFDNTRLWLPAFVSLPAIYCSFSPVFIPKWPAKAGRGADFIGPQMAGFASRGLTPAFVSSPPYTFLLYFSLKHYSKN